MAIKQRILRLVARATKFAQYCAGGVWRDGRQTWKVNVIKTLNLSVRSFMNGDVQTQACAMTYRTMLAIVPALAMLFAIGRGFGLQELITRELYTMLPAQHTAIEYAMKFVDSYLSSSSEGVFVGVGIVFLLWTLISLLMNVEDTFNMIWTVKQGRSIWRKLTDYTAMLLVFPVLMICASGMELMLSSTLQSLFHFGFLTPLITVILEVSSWLLTWMFFGAVYIMIPNTKVKVQNALLAGVFAGTGFKVLQWLFATGVMYVSRYNAIYGSFSFLPLLLIWLQLTWVVILAGAVVCYSSQNIFSFSFDSEIQRMSSTYDAQLTIAVASVVVQNFSKGKGPTRSEDIVSRYSLPPRLVGILCDRLTRGGILSRVVIDEKHELFGYQPAIEPARITVRKVFDDLDDLGHMDFIPDFDKNFPGVAAAWDKITEARNKVESDMLLNDIEISSNPTHK